LIWFDLRRNPHIDPFQTSGKNKAERGGGTETSTSHFEHFLCFTHNTQKIS